MGRLAVSLVLAIMAATLGHAGAAQAQRGGTPGVFDYSGTTAAKQFTFPPQETEWEVDQVFEYRIEDDRYGPQQGEGK